MGCKEVVLYNNIVSEGLFSLHNWMKTYSGNNAQKSNGIKLSSVALLTSEIINKQILHKKSVYLVALNLNIWPILLSIMAQNNKENSFQFPDFYDFAFLFTLILE